MSNLPAPDASRPDRTPHGAAGARNMADIARLFLDGARNMPAGGVPKRVAPTDRNGSRDTDASVSPVAPQPPMPRPQAAAPAPDLDLQASWNLPKTLLGLSGASGDAAWSLLVSAAAGIAADHATTVCVLGVREDAFVLELAGLESPEDAPKVTLGTGMADVQVARAMFTLRDAVGLWLIASPDVRTEGFAHVVGGIPQWLLAVSARNDSVVAAYQQMKQALAVGAFEETPRAFIVSEAPADGPLVHARLKKAAKDFLRQDLDFAGAAAPSSATLRVATIPLKNEERTAVWTAVVDELCAPQLIDEPETDTAPAVAPVNPAYAEVEAALERVAAASADVQDASATLSMASHAVFDQLSHVLDPEEREALAAELMPVKPSRAVAPGPVAAVVPAKPMSTPVLTSGSAQATVEAPLLATLPPKHAEPIAVPPSGRSTPTQAGRGLTLRAFDVLDHEDRDRASQWQAVERSIRDLVAESILLDAKPPMSWASDCCIAIDGNGSLHIWTLYKDGVSWFALREWAAEHRNLLALTRRDLVLNPAADVSVHIVLPLDSELATDTPTDIRALLRTPSKSVFLYRLRAVQWNTRRGILVVPIA